MSLSNQLTISRILLTFVFIFFALHSGVIFKIVAAVVFLAASLTDFCDGYYARKYNLTSDFGKLMDPVADKFLVLTAFFIFMVVHLVPVWMFVVIFFREVAVTFIRLYMLRREKVLAAEQAGKIKTVLQMFAISAVLAFMVLAEANAQLAEPFYWGIYPLMFVVVAVTLFSGVSFLWNNRRSIYA